MATAQTTRPGSAADVGRIPPQDLDAEMATLGSMMLDRHPDFSRDEVHNFVRTLPMYRIFRGMAEDESHVDRFLEEYGKKLAAASKTEITSRDLTFAQEGLNLAARRLGERIIEPVREGFIRGYSG